MKVIQGIEVDAKRFKVTPCINKQHNLEVMKYIKGEKYLEAEVGKYVYAVRVITCHGTTGIQNKRTLDQ